MALVVKNLPANGGEGLIPGSGRYPGGDGNSILAQRIPGTEELGRLQPMGSQRVRYDRRDLAHAQAVIKLKANGICGLKS